jgi:hypothetical protein
MRRESCRALVDLLLDALPSTEDVVGLTLDARSDAREDGSGVVLRATTIGTLSDIEAPRFARWPASPLVKHWIGSVQPGPSVHLHVHSVDYVADH